MKPSVLTALLTFLLLTAFAQINSNASKIIFQDAKAHLENMLTGKEISSYEQAIFLIENAWYENNIDKNNFNLAMQNHVNNIQQLIEANYDFNSTKPEPSLLYSKEQLEQLYKKALANWAIYTYMTSSTGSIDSKSITYHKPYTYSYSDPMASNNWANTQVIHLNNIMQGNCFALASLFKILSDRLHSEASLCTAPSHIYISHKDNLGTTYNIELGSKNFPGSGMISAVTYTTSEAIKNNISQRELTTQQSIALCLVYLAKGYEHKFNNITDPFILQCAETAIKYDDHNLNALLLKAEYLENKLIVKQKTFTELKKQKDFQEYQSLVANLYNLGYREMLLEMKNTLIKSYKKEKIEAPQTDDQIEQRYATISWGLFDESHKSKEIERISNTLFNTKSKKIASFAKDQTLYNNYNFDPVVFAWNIDPLFKNYTSLSPYVFVANNPIKFIDPDGSTITVPNVNKREPVLSNINELSYNQYSFDTKGELYIDECKGTNKHGSKYYSKRIEDGIAVNKEIRIMRNQKIMLFEGYYQDVDKDFGGGATREKWQEDRIDVTVSGNEDKDVKDTDGKPLKDGPAEILMHEMVGHAIPKATGKKDTGDAIEDENKVRKELPGGKQRREAKDEKGKPKDKE